MAAAQASTTEDKRRMADLSGGSGDSPRPRGPRGPLTDDFENLWPALEAAIRRFLQSRGLDAHDTADLTQEVAYRVLARDHRWATEEDLRRYCFVIARNLHVDYIRQQTRFSAADVTDRADIRAADRLDQVEDRRLLAKVDAVAPELSARDWAALAPAARGASPAERNRANVARSRARARLRYLVGPLAGTLPPLGVWARRWMASLRRAAVVTTPVALIVLFVLGVSVSPTELPALRDDASPQAAATPVGRSTDHRDKAAAAGPAVGSASSSPAQALPAPAVTPLVVVSGPGKAHVGLGLRPQGANEGLACLDNPQNPSDTVCLPQPQQVLCTEPNAFSQLVCGAEATGPTLAPAIGRDGQ